MEHNHNEEQVKDLQLDQLEKVTDNNTEHDGHVLGLFRPVTAETTPCAQRPTVSPGTVPGWPGTSRAARSSCARRRS